MRKIDSLPGLDERSGYRAHEDSSCRLEASQIFIVARTKSICSCVVDKVQLKLARRLSLVSGLQSPLPSNDLTSQRAPGDGHSSHPLAHHRRSDHLQIHLSHACCLLIDSLSFFSCQRSTPSHLLANNNPHHNLTPRMKSISSAQVAKFANSIIQGQVEVWNAAESLASAMHCELGSDFCFR